MSRILIIEDEEAIADLEKDYLELSGFEVEIENRGDTGLVRAMKEEFDLIILDLMLPEVDGFDICRQVREEKNTPIIMVSAKKDDIDKIRGLGLGADDYMTKPFNILEVKARIKAIKRRNRHIATADPSTRIVAGNMVMDRNNRHVYIKGKEISLTTKEYDVLELLVTNPNKVYGREMLLSLIWGYDYPGDARTVDVHIRRLREKIESNPSEPEYVHTKWGMGYFFKQ